MIQMPGAKIAPRHEQVRIEGTPIDVRMGQLIKYLWHREYRTSMSCQGDDTRMAYVQFTSMTQAKRFFEGTLDRLHTTVLMTSKQIVQARLALRVTLGEDDAVVGIVSFHHEALDSITAVWAI